jgi:hypothetical protein
MYDVEPLAVPLGEAGRLGGHGRDKTYALIKAGELESYRDGGQRMVTMASIKARQARLIAAEGGSFKPAPLRGQPDTRHPKRRTGRPVAA